MKPKKTNLVDLMSDKDRAKVEAREAAMITARNDFITREWLTLSELGFYYGWEAIIAVLTDVIDLPQMNILVEGGRKIHAAQVFDQAVAARAGNCSQEGFEILTKPYRDDIKAVN